MKDRARARTESMRAERAAQAARQKRNQRLLAVGGGVVILGLLIAIVFAVVNASRGDENSGTEAGGKVVVPSNLVDGGVLVGEETAPVTIDLYFDYMCPACGAFEAGNADDLTSAIEDGTAKVNLHVMNFLDAQSNGTEYSTRAGNALGVVANDTPDAVWDFHNALYANQPAEGTDGLSDDDIALIATESGVPSEVADSFNDGTYRGWVAQSNQAAGEAGVSSTPTVKINGETFEGNWAEPGVLAAAIEVAAEDD